MQQRRQTNLQAGWLGLSSHLIGCGDWAWWRHSISDWDFGRKLEKTTRKEWVQPTEERELRKGCKRKGCYRSIGLLLLADDGCVALLRLKRRSKNEVWFAKAPRHFAPFSTSRAFPSPIKMSSVYRKKEKKITGSICYVKTERSPRWRLQRQKGPQG
jgi:hypothetical protein